MKYIKPISLLTTVLALSGCLREPTLAQVYWQRVDGDSGLYMTGPKAQQILDENISHCVVEIEELVKLDALRETTPPDTHNDYHEALEKSGDLDYYDTPRRLGDLKVAHSDYHDFESCMRSKGWERVKYLRYDVGLGARETYKKTQYYRQTGKMMLPEEDTSDTSGKLKYFNYNE